MNRTELATLIDNGENSGVEFERDDITPQSLAREMAALLNLQGGHILLGVEDDGSVSGLTREAKKTEEWVMEAARTHLRPAAIPFWETLSWGSSETVGVVSLPADAPDKPYKYRRGSSWVTQTRAGTTSRDATDEEEARLYMQSGRLSYDRKPVPGAGLEDLDMRRLVNYFRDMRRQPCPPAHDHEAWTRLLVNTELMYVDRGRTMPSAGGLLLLGTRPQKYLPQAGISAAAYTGTEKDYAARARATLRGAVVSLYPAPNSELEPFQSESPATFSEADNAVEAGVIGQAMDFVRRNIEINASLDGGSRRTERWDYPIEAVREATGLGVPRKIVAGMRAHNGTDPDLVEDESRFIVRLWKHRRDAAVGGQPAGPGGGL